ncbi:hypothetical protein AB3G45_07870 [Shinella sp. S4-D37]|uniref:hypothetical protein n=1 Tax=Shinella sp. S4-D37 TaxID=3161999 RepID=UPI003465947A
MYRVQSIVEAIARLAPDPFQRAGRIEARAESAALRLTASRKQKMLPHASIEAP